jgi:hypothetical protein
MSVTLSSLSAWVLAVVLVVAAGAKLVRGDATGAEMAELGLVAPGLLARLVPMAELVAAALLVILPPWGGTLSFALLAAFTAVLIQVLRSGRTVSCSCFGGLADRPISRWTLARNVVLLLLAAVAAAG